MTLPLCALPSLFLPKPLPPLRVEDDDTSSSFPFNSCGTAAYVAPEALICNKKVNSSVDVSATVWGGKCEIGQ